MAERNLDDILAEAKAKEPDQARIEEYAVTVDGRRIVLRDPAMYKAREAEGASSGFSGQLRLLTETHKDFRVLWGKLGEWEQAYLEAFVDDVVGHYADQRKKAKSAMSSADTREKSSSTSTGI